MPTTPTLRTVCCILVCLATFIAPAYAQSLDQTGQQWSDQLEWTIENPSFDGNPFDVLAQAEFTHQDSGEVRRTALFYAGNDQWRFRFTGTQTGNWSFETTSNDPELNGVSGDVTIHPCDNPKAHGFVTHDQNHWTWSATGEAFIPQIVMYRSPEGYYQKPDVIDADLKLWFDEHGFNGLHTDVLCRWFDFDKKSSDEFDTDDPNPDPRTFEALELLITKAHAAGGFVHIWAWGDDSRNMTPTRWGINGRADQRLQRYIAARLGPLPGWTMGYGFDLWEWVDEEDLVAWHNNLHRHLGWKTLVGGRIHRHGDPLENLITDKLDYIGYEVHRPSAQTYLDAMALHPHKPVMMEDRFRVRMNSRYPEKDYDLELTRRGLWHSAMAGGVGNIWGYLVPEAEPDGMSQPYPNRAEIRTYATFFEKHFNKHFSPNNALTDGRCLAHPSQQHYLFYKESADSVEFDLSNMRGEQSARAVDTQKPYQEVEIGVLVPKKHVWQAPYASDWAIAVGEPQ